MSETSRLDVTVVPLEIVIDGAPGKVYAVAVNSPDGRWCETMSGDEALEGFLRGLRAGAFTAGHRVEIAKKEMRSFRLDL